jgi:hypothetical protein
MMLRPCLAVYDPAKRIHATEAGPRAVRLRHPAPHCLLALHLYTLAASSSLA